MTKQSLVKDDPKNTKQIKKQDIPEKKKRGRPKTKKQQIKQDEINIEYDFNNIDTTIVQFFNNIEQSNLVFEEATREVLRRNHPNKQINIKPEYDFKAQSEQIKKQIPKLEIIQFLETKQTSHTKLVQQLCHFFQQASKYFASEVTPELYNILSKSCNIVFRNYKDTQKRIKQLRQFGDSIPTLQKENQYFYFGFNMFKLPPNKTQNDIANLKKHNPYYKYILKQKYRQPNGPYADFIEKIGGFVLKIIKESKVMKIFQV